MATLLSHIIGKEHLILSSERTLFWENENALIVADLHVGKTGHFRKAGIGVPSAIYKDDLHRLLAQILFFKAERLIIVGDLTHSIANREMDLFRKWRKDFPSLEVHLAKGNHDILDNRWYEEADISVHNEPFAHGDFLFVHDLVNPGIAIRGKAKQFLCFPCFYFTETYCILPAFSRFTGTYQVHPQKGEKAFAIVDKEIMMMPGR